MSVLYPRVPHLPLPLLCQSSITFELILNVTSVATLNGI